jgi:hypothetical protein
MKVIEHKEVRGFYAFTSNYDGDPAQSYVSFAVIGGDATVAWGALVEEGNGRR